MVTTAQICIAMLAVLAAVVMIARRWHIPSPILLVPAGLLMAIEPHIPDVTLSPAVVMQLFLPPLIHSAAFMVPWPEFKANLRPIGLLAVGCVVFTTGMVAITAHYLIHMPWAVATVLGAVVSPPDAIAATSVAARLPIPRRIITILQGEGLVNDATALTIMRFAIAAAVSGTFSIWHATGTFGLIVIGESAWGVVVGWLVTKARGWTTDPRVETTLSLLAPYAAFWPCEFFHGSGVLAAVASGMYVGYRAIHSTASASRLQGWYFWDAAIFIIEGLLFLLTGLQFSEILKHLAGDTALQITGFAAAVCGVMIVFRFLWVYPATYLPRWIPSIRKKDPPPPWQYPFVISFAGMRGAVSLAAALSIPFGFPDRDLIIVLTFAAILVTLCGQGLTLPLVIRRLRLDNHGRREQDELAQQELDARLKTITSAIDRLSDLAEKEGLPADVVETIRVRHEQRARHLCRRKDGDGDHVSDRVEKLEQQLLEVERETLYGLLRNDNLPDPILRRLERELDLREVRLKPDDED